MKEANGNPEVREVRLHVQVNNEAAKKFYTEKFQFEEVEIVQNYYKKVEPADGYLLRKMVQH